MRAAKKRKSNVTLEPGSVLVCAEELITNAFDGSSAVRCEVGDLGLAVKLIKWSHEMFISFIPTALDDHTSPVAPVALPRCGTVIAIKTNSAFPSDRWKKII